MTLQKRHYAIIALWVLALGALLFTWLGNIGPFAKSRYVDEIGQGDYQLQTTTGETFTSDSLKGAPSLVYFGFTHCPEICPTTMADISTWQEELGPRAKDLRVYLITVDPERDTLDVLEDYVGWLENGVGVSGDPQEIKKAEQAFKVYSTKEELSNGDYTMNHSALIFAFDANGDYFGVIPYGQELERGLETLERLLPAG